MGLMYKLFGVNQKPRSIEEFRNYVFQQRPKEVTVRIGREFRSEDDAMLKFVSPYIKLEAEGVSYRENPLPGDRVIAYDSSKEPLKKDLTLAVCVLELRDIFASKGIQCKIFKDDEFIDERKENKIKKQAKKIGVKFV